MSNSTVLGDNSPAGREKRLMRLGKVELVHKLMHLESGLLAAREAQSKPADFYTEVSGKKGVIWHHGTPADDTAVFTAPPAVPREMLDAMDEVIRISDRDHDAWSRAKRAISAYRAAMPNHVGNSTEKAEPVTPAYRLADLAAAVNTLLDNDGSRGTFNAIGRYDALQEVERLIATTSTQEGDDGGHTTAT